MNELLNSEFVFQEYENVENTISRKPSFVINDIELPIAPLNIAIQKEDLVYKYKTLRTNTTTKVGSGRGVYNLQLSLMFPQEMLLMLHRLVIQIKNCPFVYIKNNYITSALKGLVSDNINVFFTVTNFHIRTSEKSPNTFIVNMDLRFFNYKPYAGNLIFKKDLWTKSFNTNFTEGGESTQLTIPVFDPSRAVVKTKFNSNNVLGTTRQEQDTLLELLNERVSEFEDYGEVNSPASSNIYVRYYNQLQLDSLEKNFNIKSSNIQSELGRQSSFYEEGKNTSENRSYVLGIHSKYMPIRIRNSIINRMLKGSNPEQPEDFTRFNYYEYKYAGLSVKAVEYLKELLNSNQNIETEQDLQSYVNIRSRFYFLPNAIELNVNQNTLTGDILAEANVIEAQENLIISPVQQSSIENIFIIYAPVDNCIVSPHRGKQDIQLKDSAGSTICTIKGVESFTYLKNRYNAGTPIGVLIINQTTFNCIYEDQQHIERFINLQSGNSNSRQERNENELLSEIKSFTESNRDYFPVVQEFASNVFQKGNEIDFLHKKNIESAEHLTSSSGTVTAISASFANLISSIPIAEYEHPTHQFLGSMEPSYAINIVSKNIVNNRDIFLQNINKMQATLSENSRLFKEVYDSGNLRIRTFLTKLLGTYKYKNEQNVEEKEKRNCIIDSVTSETVEGLPGVSSTVIRFSETNSIQDEKLEVADARATNQQLEAKYKNAYLSALGIYRAQNPREQEVAIQNTPELTSTYEPRNWKTKHFDADKWYRKPERKRIISSRNQITNFQDRCAYQLCRLLDVIQDAFPGNIVTLRDTFNNRGSTSSHHEVNCAVDINVQGVNVATVVRSMFRRVGGVGPFIGEGGWTNFIYDRQEPDTPLVNTIGIGVYGTGASEDENILMDGSIDGGMIHIDLNIKRQLLLDPATTIETPRLAFRKENDAGDLVLSGRRWYGKDRDARYFWDTDRFRWVGKELVSDGDGDAVSEDNDADEQVEANTIPGHVSFEIQRGRVQLDQESLRTFLQEQAPSLDLDLDNLTIEANSDRGGYVVTFGNVLDINSFNQIRNLEIDGEKVFFGARQEEIVNAPGNRYVYLSTARISETSVPLILGLVDSGTELRLQRELVTLIKMIRHFKDFAEIVLTEPKHYVQEDEIATELARIKSELLDIDLEPRLYETLGLKINDIGGHSFNLNTAESFDFLVEKNISSGEIGNGGDSNVFEVHSTLNEGIQELIVALTNEESFKIYNEEANALRSYSDVAQLINTRIGASEGEQLNVFSEGIIGREIEQFIWGLLSYRLSEISATGQLLSSIIPTADWQTIEDRHTHTILEPTTDRDNLASYIRNRTPEGLSGYYSLVSRHSNASSPGDQYIGENSSVLNLKWDIRAGTSSDQFFNKEVLRQRQDAKISYLRRLLFAMISKIITNESFRRYANIDVVESLFKIDLGKESAYPDLNLPMNPLGVSSDRYLNPGFFFYKKEVNLQEKHDQYKNILDNSIQFMNYLQGGVYSGTTESLVQRGQDLLLTGETANVADLLIAQNEGTENPIVSHTSTNERGESSNINAREQESEENALPVSERINYQTLTVAEINNIRSNQRGTFEVYSDKLLGQSNSASQFISSFERSSTVDGQRVYERLTNRNNDLSPEDTESISKNIYEDIRKQKKRIENAFPTFKLYLIEEDATDSESYFVYDDFYSYNSVLDFTVHKSRKLASDVAVIRLQNVSGSLDGTKRGGKRDIDIEKEFEEIGFVGDTVSFNSMVLRPGVNAQLRAGYSSNPNKLEILISGRIADVSYSNQTDMIEVSLQSFGYELEAKKYGGVSSNHGGGIEKTTFYSTRSLLAYLILDESLTHFGRYKTGRVFQTNENIDNTFVKNKRVNESWFNFSWTNSLLDSLNSTNPAYAAIIVAVGLLATRGNGRIAAGIQRFFSRPVQAFRDADNVFANGLKLFGGGVGKFYQTSRLFRYQRALYNRTAGLPLSVWNIIRRRGNVVNNATPNFGIVDALSKGWIETSVLATGVLLGTVAVESVVNVLGAVLGAGSSAFDKWTTPNVKLLKLDPQDDNIFAPPLEVYTDESYKDDTWTSRLEKSAESAFFYVLDIATWGFAASVRDDQQEILNEFYKEPFKYFDKRLPTNLRAHVFDFNQLLGGKTTWELFEEMSLRHPGYVYGARQYGDGLEYRMFFGLPTMRYWKKDLNPSKARRLNSIYNDLRSDRDSIELEKYFSIEEITYLKSLYTNRRNELRENALNNAVKVLLRKEWQETTEDRFVPFRKFHVVDSSKNLIANQIKVNTDIVNTVGVSFKQGNTTFTRTLKAHENLNQSQIKSIQIANPNCISYQGALRYGISTLMNSAKEMYSGEIVVLGNPSINPYDACLLRDKYLDMYGPLEVESVTHIFGHDTGFITEIKPNALVTSNESITFPLLNNLIFAEATKEFEEQLENRRYIELSKEQQNEVVKRAINEVFESEEFENIVTDEITPEQRERLRKFYISEFQRRIEAGDVITLQDILNQTGTTPEILSGVEQTIDRAIYGLAAITGGLALRSVFRFAAGTLRSRLINGGGLAAAASVVAGYGSGTNTTEQILNGIRNPNSLTHSLFKSFTTGDMHIARIGATQAMQIFPLYRHGLPLIAGGFENISPQNIWKNRFGEIFNATNDAITGLRNESDRLRTLDYSDVYDYTFTGGARVLPETVRFANDIFGFARDETVRGYFINQAREEAAARARYEDE